ncbi:MAG: hypothetical protein M0Q93_00935 [Terrimicrobiaceae bacterium]|nr:hypothetical protein [Terrimicrobiaceae bacterium]
MKTIFKVQIFFKESHRKMRPDSKQVVNWLVSKGFETCGSCFLDTFFVYFNGKNKKGKNRFRDNLDLHLLAMSERNSSDCALLITEEFQNDERAIISTWFLVPPSDNGMKYFKKFIKSNPKFYKKLKELRLFYSQVEPHTQLIHGLSLLEEWFDTKPEHCLTKDEQSNVIKAIKRLKFGSQKEEKIIEKIKDSSFLAIKSRNKRIAEVINKYCDLNLKKTEKQIKEIYKARAKGAHSTDTYNPKKELEFLKLLFRKFLYEEYAFIKLNLH